MSTENGEPGPDGRWYRADGTLATDDEAAAAIWGSPSSPQRFRKKPVEVEAMQFDGTNADVIFDWVIGISGPDHPDMRAHAGKADGWNEPARILIETLEGTMRADIGDWLIRGVQGEFYPCKPDIFEQTYEKVS